jgi:hypothetical protein
MIQRHPEIAHVYPSAAAPALHKVIDLALRHPTVWLPDDLTARDFK